MKKFLCIMLVAMMAFGFSVSALAIPTEMSATIVSGTQQEYLKNTKIKTNLTMDSQRLTVADVDALMFERGRATVNNDSMRVIQIDNMLESMGVEKVTYGEVLSLTGGEEIYGLDNANYVSSSNNIVFQTCYGEIEVDGNVIDTMHIYASPQRGSNMYHENTVSGIGNNGTAGELEFIGIWGKYGIGLVPYIGQILGFLEAMIDSYAALTPDTPISGIESEYNYDCVENTVFVYYWNDFSQNWVQIGVSSYLTYSVVHILNAYYMDGYLTVPCNKVEQFNGELVTYYYNDAEYMYTNRGDSGVQTDDQFRQFCVSGVAGIDDPDVIVPMLCPGIPAMCS